MRVPTAVATGLRAPLWRDPIAWFAARFVMYGTAAGCATLLFLGVTGVYALLHVPPAPPPVNQEEQQLSEPTSPPAPFPSAPTEKPAPVMSVNKPALPASRLLGLYVYDPANKRVGDVNDILFDSTGAPHAVVIGYGGFLGLGEKTAVVPFGSVRWLAKGNNQRDWYLSYRDGADIAAFVPDRAVVPLTQNDLKNAEAFTAGNLKGRPAAR